MMFVYDEQQQQYVQEAQEITNVPTQPPLDSTRFARVIDNPRLRRGLEIMRMVQKNHSLNPLE